jgi:sulfur carrier protein
MMPSRDDVAATEAALIVNGQEIAFATGTIEDLLTRLSIDPARRGLAVAVNGEVVRRAGWPSRRLAPGDWVEIVQPLAGG